MKYLVQVSYTNPAHEHVSLRRRVDTVNRIVEATDEQQAILRVSRQQQALGFLVREAKIVVPPTTINEDVEEVKEEVEQTDEALRVRDDTGSLGNLKKAKPGASLMGQSHAQDTRTAAARDVGDIRKKTAGNPAARRDAMSKAGYSVVRTEEASKEGKNVMRSVRSSLKSMDLRHGVDSDKRVSGYKMSPAVKAAQAKSDALSKPVKRPQAGTLAAVHKSMEREMERSMKKEEVEYIEEKLTAADPASKWISDFVASDNPKFAGKSKKERINMALGAYYAAKREKNEAVEKTYNEKEVKAAEKKREKKKGSMNKLNMEPEMKTNSPGVR